jgi:hypothetical protein
MGELIGMVFSRISTIFMVAGLWDEWDDGANDRQRGSAAPMPFFLSLMP